MLQSFQGHGSPTKRTTQGATHSEVVGWTPKLRRSFIFAFLLITIVGGTAWLTLIRRRPPEPSYEGKPLSYWLTGLYPYSEGVQLTNVPKNFESMKAVKYIGTNAFPMLLRRLEAHDSAFVLKVKHLVNNQKIVKFKSRIAIDKDQNLQGWAGFEVLIRDSAREVPALIRILERHNSDSSKAATIAVLGNIGPSASAAVAAVVSEMGNTTNRYVLFSCFSALGSIHSQPELAVPALMKCLNDPSADIRRSSITALQEYRPKRKAGSSCTQTIAQ